MSSALEEWRTSVEIVGDFLKSAPVDLPGMADALKIPVTIDSSLPDDVSGKIEKDRAAPSGFRITINGRHHPNRQRFTLAHEIAHFVLHRDLIGDGITDSGLYRSALRSDLETQANRYAADLIMPAALVRRKFREGVKSYSEMANAFQVSSEVAQIRMKSVLGAS